MRKSARTSIGLGMRGVLSAALTLLAVGPSHAQDKVKLASGEELTVQIVEQTDATVKFVHPVLGEMTLSRNLVTVVPPPPPPPPPPESFLEGWKGKVELGLNGTDGNSETLNLRAGAEAKRVTATAETKLTLTYAYATDDGQTSKNRLEFEGRQDWLFAEGSPWGFFLIGRYEYDDFQDWDYRLSGFAGPSYTFIKSEATLLRGRVGAGATREFGSSRNEVIPEGLVGVDVEHKLDERQSLFATLEYLPSFDDAPNYRLVGKAGYEILLDPESAMSLKLGATDKYNSSPGAGFKKNDVEYFLTIGFNF